MVLRVESMLLTIVKAACILVPICLVSQTRAKPALEQQWINLAPLRHHIPVEESRPFYVECLSTSECVKHTCCVIGHQKFSIPRCSALGEQGDYCFPGAVAVARNLTYPDGETVKYNGVFEQACPCSPDLYCNRYTHTCEDGLEHAHNTLDAWSMDD